MKIPRTLKQCLALLGHRDRVRYFRFAGVQLLTTFLDLAGILLLSGLTVFGSLALDPAKSANSQSFTNKIFKSLSEHFSSNSAFLTTLLLTAIFFFSVKSVLSLWLLRRMYTFLSHTAASFSSYLARVLFKQDLLFIQKRSSQETAAALSYAVNYAVVDTLGAGIILISEYSLLGLLALSLFIIDPLVTMAAFMYFALVIYFLQVRLLNLAAKSGEAKTNADIQGTETIQEALSLYRELTISDRREYFIAEFEGIRMNAAQASVDSQWVGLVPKYSLETALVIGSGLLGLSQFVTKDVAGAVGTLTLFLAAGSRVLPSLLRIQSAVTTVRYAGAAADVTFKLAAEADVISGQISSKVTVQQPVAEKSSEEFVGSIEIDSVSFTYPSQNVPALKDVSLKIVPGETLAVVGASGAGKSTLTDVILGVIPPNTGEIKISGLSPKEATHRWPGKIAYVPQLTALANKTIRENVALGRDIDEIDDVRVWASLRFAQLDELVEGLERQLSAHIGEQGHRLSGGQRQRLGIARALYTQPEILVLDEATSAMDSDTEYAIAQALTKLAGHTTLIIIAHRLSTVRKADQVIYLNKGRSEAIGTFDEVRKLVSDFDRQASLLGL